MCQACERSRHSVVTTANRRRRSGCGSAATAAAPATLAPTALTNVLREIMTTPHSVKPSRNGIGVAGRTTATNTSLARLQVPHLDGLVLTPRAQPFAVRAQRQAED